MAAELGSSYLDELADFANRTQLADVPAPALTYLRAIIADTLAASAAGNQEAEMKALLAKQLPQVAAGHASVIGSGRRLNPMDAAALNAAAGCWLELDEGNLATNGHPGIQVLPAAFAVAQQLGCSGEQLLLACALGYEICGRIGGACDMRMEIHPHGTYGVVGAAVAVAKLQGLDPRRMRELISLAGSSPIGGNRRSMKDGATLRNWYAAHSALMGQMAVRLVESGFTGPLDGVAATCEPTKSHRRPAAWSLAARTTRYVAKVAPPPWVMESPIAMTRRGAGGSAAPRTEASSRVAARNLMAGFRAVEGPARPTGPCPNPKGR